MGPADSIPVEDDPEGAQSDVFQDDGVGQDADLLLRQIDGDLLELLFEGDQVGSQVVGCGDAFRSDRCRQVGLKNLQLAPQNSQGVVQVLQHLLARDEPAAGQNQPEPLGDAAHFLPPLLRKLCG
jgi:hypothetical protein